jgi:hypothetical protein
VRDLEFRNLEIYMSRFIFCVLVLFVFSGCTTAGRIQDYFDAINPIEIVLVEIQHKRGFLRGKDLAERKKIFAQRAERAKLEIEKLKNITPPEEAEEYHESLIRELEIVTEVPAAAESVESIYDLGSALTSLDAQSSTQSSFQSKQRMLFRHNYDTQYNYPK